MTGYVDLAGYMREVQAEMENAGARFGAAIVKRRGKSVEDGYAVMPFAMFVRLLAGVDA